MNLIEQAMIKYPKARKIAVENASAGIFKLDYAASANIAMDARMYKWTAQTVNAIKWVINQQAKQVR